MWSGEPFRIRPIRWWQMPELNDDILDALMHRHIARELDGQVGRAQQEFHRVLSASSGAEGAATASPAGERSPRAVELKPQRTRSFWRDGVGGRFVLLGGTALAASILALFAAPLLFNRVPTTPVTPGGATGAPVIAPQTVSQPMLHMVHSRTFDEGTTVLGGADEPIPARKIRRVRIDQTQWYDREHNARIEVTAPSEDVRFMEVDTY